LITSLPFKDRIRYQKLLKNRLGELIIDYKQVSEDALVGICREYIISHINETDSEIELEQWIKQVRQQVVAGELLIEFSEEDESVTLKKLEDILPVEERYKDLS